MAKSQEGFLKCIVLPLFEAFEQFAAMFKFIQFFEK